MKESKLNLSFSIGQIWIAIGIFIGLFGTIYAAGLKTAYELSKIEIIKMEQKHMDEISDLNNTIRNLNTQNKELLDDRDYLQRRVNIINNRYIELETLCSEENKEL